MLSTPNAFPPKISNIATIVNRLFPEHTGNCYFFENLRHSII